MRVVALHGFLGKPSDWDGPAARVRALATRSRPEFAAPDPFAVERPSPGRSPASWGRAFAESAARDLESPVLLGYSLGGRLAMHALAAAPARWRAAILVSAHPGLPAREREARIALDERRAAGFETRPWDDLLREWAAEPAFGGRALPWDRREEAYDRADLAGALRAWSLGRQDDLLPFLAAWERPVAWVAGEGDPRYVDLGARLDALRLGAGRASASIVVPGAAHRVPWEAPDAFARSVAAFLDGLE